MAKKKRKRQDKEKKPYNTRMIREFLDHLLWDIRARHAENDYAANHNGEQMPDNPDLMDTLSGRLKQRPCHLIPATGFKMKGVEPDTARQLIIAYCRKKAAMLEDSLQHLENLQPIFDVALRCADMPQDIGKGEQPTKHVDLAEWLARHIKEGDIDGLSELEEDGEEDHP